MAEMKENKMEELKQTICRLDDERKNVEIEMNACLGRLNDAGVGLNGSLVDQEVRVWLDILDSVQYTYCPYHYCWDIHIC